MNKTIVLLSVLVMGVAMSRAADAFVDSVGSVSFYTDSYVSFEYMGRGSGSTRDLSEWQDFTFSMYTHNGAGGITETFTTPDSMTAGTFDQLLKAGVDSVGFVVSNGSDTIYSTPDEKGKYYVVTQWEGDLLYIGFFVKGFGNKPIEQADIIYAVAVEPREPPTGQPLPGVFASLLIGAGALRLRRRRK